MKKVIGITGGIATGKSQVTAYLRAQGHAVIDADEVVHALQAPGAPLSGAIAETFGGDFLSADGAVDRAKLGALVFSDIAANKKLSALTEKIVRSELLRQRDAAADSLVFMDIPLLFEQHYENEVDEIWLVYAPRNVQLSRLVARNQLTEAAANARLDAQFSIEEKCARADVILENTRTRQALIEAIKVQLARLLKQR
ncbi:MAG: dephospho-CoA kinase [Streptococcaceae bacterium]|nr:dephospho-CoA kinase [Streptococcaceae bacterium]